MRPADGRRRFVVQRHRASRLHYDLRLEIDGVLVSWAVPEGPDARPDGPAPRRARRGPPARLPRFEGIIPAGEYGGGDVIVWDAGTWEPDRHRRPGWPRSRDGELHFELHGQKLRGRFVLVRTRRADADGKEQWLLLHKHDEHAVAGWDPEDHPRSVLSGRTNDEVQADPDRLGAPTPRPPRPAVALLPDPLPDEASSTTSTPSARQGRGRCSAGRCG